MPWLLIPVCVMLAATPFVVVAAGISLINQHYDLHDYEEDEPY